MFQNGGFVSVFNIRHGMRAAFVTDKQTVALRIVTGILSLRSNLYQSAISLIGKSGGNTLGDNFLGSVFTDMNHFGSGIGLLTVVG